MVRILFHCIHVYIFRSDGKNIPFCGLAFLLFRFFCFSRYAGERNPFPWNSFHLQFIQELRNFFFVIILVLLYIALYTQELFFAYVFHVCFKNVLLCFRNALSYAFVWVEFWLRLLRRQDRKMRITKKFWLNFRSV